MRSVVWLAPLVFFAMALSVATVSAEQRAVERVLITNDDGIAEPRLATMARAFAAAGAEVWVVASDSDRSGYSNYTPATRGGRFSVRAADFGDGIHAYEVQGSPADCVIFALTGPMREAPPTLVVSGPNGGANAGDDWIGSGTIGAVRTAAYLGIPAIAVSGFEALSAEETRIAAEWIVAVSRSRLVSTLAPPNYFTVSFPETPLSQVRGVEVTRRARGLLSGEARLQGQEGGWEHWSLQVQSGAAPTPRTDVDALARGNIAIVPMRVGDYGADDARALRRLSRLTPAWTPPAVQQTCRFGFGTTIDDADDSNGDEIGVAIVSIVAGGAAERAGILPGDVILRIGDVALAETQLSPEPTDAFVRELSRFPCQPSVTLTVQRGDRRLTVDVVRQP